MFRLTPKYNRLIGAAVALAVLGAPGCFASGDLSGIRRDLEHQLPGASFNRNVEFSVGPILLGLTRMVTAFVPDAHEARSWLSGISRVDIGVYDAQIDGIDSVHMPRKLQSLVDQGWETAIRVRDRDEAAWVLYRPDGNRVREVFIVVLDDEQLVMVKARGRLDQLIAAALREARGERGFLDELHG